MNRQCKFSCVLASVMAMILALPGGVWADGGPYGYGRYAGAPPYHAPYYPRYYPRYYPHYYPNYPCNNCGNHHHNNHDHDNNLWYGLLGGGIVGYALGNIYPVPQQTAHGYYPPANAVPPPATPYASPAAVSPCLQEREYRTKIMVGGKQVDGYGTACLQPDGSWRYGTAQAESN